MKKKEYNDYPSTTTMPILLHILIYLAPFHLWFWISGYNSWDALGLICLISLQLLLQKKFERTIHDYPYLCRSLWPIKIGDSWCWKYYYVDPFKVMHPLDVMDAKLKGIPINSIEFHRKIIDDLKKTV